MQQIHSRFIGINIRIASISRRRTAKFAIRSWKELLLSEMVSSSFLNGHKLQLHSSRTGKDLQHGWINVAVKLFTC